MSVLDRLRRGAGTRPKHVALRELLLGSVSPLERRVRARIVEHLVDDLLRTDDRFGLGLARSGSISWSSFLSVAAVHLPAQLIEQRQIVSDFESFAARYGAVGSSSARKATIRDHLHATVTDQRKLRGDVAAVGRYLDFDALRERNAQKLHGLNVRDELLMSALGRLFERWQEHGASNEALLTAVTQDRIDTVLVEEARLQGTWRRRLAAVMALARLAHALRGDDDATQQLDPSVVRLSTDLAYRRFENPWVQRAALDVLFATSPSSARMVARRRIFDRSHREPRHDFVTRKLLIDLFVQRSAEPYVAELLEALGADMDPSEHVQIGLCNLGARRRTPQALAVLQGRAEQGNWRVRLVAGRGLCRFVSGALVNEEAPTVVEPAVEQLYALLDRETDTRTLVPLLGDVRRMLHESLGTPGAVELLRVEQVGALLEQRLANIELRPSVHESMSATLEVVDQRLREPLRRALETLEPIVQRTGVGRSRALRLGAAASTMTPQIMGRALAQLTREDFGVEISGTRWLRLFRGDHWRLRAWRFLHEITHPAPNKRAAHRHVIGRRRHGLIRAHPAILDEVTVTVVPGERLRSEYEGGWGRHLPLVDDVLDLPFWRRRHVSLFSSHGVTTLMPPSGLLRRLWTRLKITMRYRALSSLRRESLDAQETALRGRYVNQLRSEYGIAIEFTPYTRLALNGRAAESPHVRALFDVESTSPASSGTSSESEISATATRAAGLAVAPGLPTIDWIEEAARSQADYFVTMSSNGQVALSLFVMVLICHFFVSSFLKQRAVRLARERIPLCIGGWGTRGKSGTERLKAALFSGMGYDVYSKTTGCEAMMLHSSDGETPGEVFLFRPYDKATIWEHSTTIQQAASLGAEVFLWECMALNPRYVELLQLQWMRDDLATITNTYPDHEDIQGPAGADVAQVISRFTPASSRVVSAEVNFAPVLREAAAERKSTFNSLDTHEEVYLAEDFLALFPYAEHPRNIALVRRVSDELGVDPDYATYIMAESVVPDIGVLKRFAPTRVAGRVLTFISGQSANERTGFMNNWRRMGCDALDLEDDYDHFVMTVVNNRADRISRSVVFAKILVNDISADRHVLIGSNLKGLLAYIRTALDEFLATIDVVRQADLAAGAPADVPKRRLQAVMARLRIPLPSSEGMAARVKAWGANAGIVVGASECAALAQVVERVLSNAGTVGSVADLEASLEKDEAVMAMFSAAKPGGEVDGTPEVYESAPVEELRGHFCRAAARMAVHAKLQLSLDEALAGSMTAQAFHQRVADAYRELFMHSLDVEYDVYASGDSIVLRCARALPPGAHALLMGSQNIKGTGLDFAYRWLALESVDRARTELLSETPARIEDGVRMLEGLENLGLMGAGLGRATVAHVRRTAGEGIDSGRLVQLAERLEQSYRAAVAGLGAVGGSSKMDGVFNVAEQAVDFLDAVVRARLNKRIMADLNSGRISHGRAAVVMRDLTKRQKGGWLGKRVLRWTNALGSLRARVLAARVRSDGEASAASIADDRPSI